MAVYKRGKVYWYNFTFKGERYQDSTGSRNKADAKTIEAKKRADLALEFHGLKPQKPGPPLSEYTETFLEYVRTHNADHPQTIKFYEEKVRRLLEFAPLAEKRINLIDEAAIEEYVQFRVKKRAAITTINLALKTLRRLLNVAKDTHKLLRDVPKITLLPGEKARVFVLTYEQEAVYLDAIDDPFLRDFAVLALDTGVRAGEGVKLPWADVFLDLDRLRIRVGKTENAVRAFVMTPRVKAMLERRRKADPEAVFVFQTPYFKEPTPITVWHLDNAHRKAKLKARMPDGKELPAEFVVHSLRHTFGTRLGESGADPNAIKEIMGHSTVKVSEKYIHPTAGNIERSFARLEAMNSIMRDAATVSATIDEWGKNDPIKR